MLMGNNRRLNKNDSSFYYAARKTFWLSRWSWGMLPRKIFKIKGPRLAKNAFPRFRIGKLDNIKSARSLALKFGRFKKLSAGFGGGQLPPLPPASYGPVFVNKLKAALLIFN